MNKYSTLFFAPYLKDGQFKVIIFDRDRELLDLNLNELLDIEEYTRPNDNFPYPHMDGCFFKDNTIFINLYRTQVKKMVMIKLDPFSGELKETPIEESFPDTQVAKRNFPLGTFYDELRGKVYMIFRQGQAYTHDLNIKKSLTV